jgi:N-acetylmuramoyl-L-alanine amidase
MVLTHNTGPAGLSAATPVPPGPSDNYDVVADLAPFHSRRRPGRLIEGMPRFIVAHDTGNPGANARTHARWYQNDPNPPNDRISSAHLFVDDKEIVECIPALTDPPEQALHVLYRASTDNKLYGVDANRAAIGVEYCYGGSIDAEQAYRRYVWVIANLRKIYQLNPLRDVVGHDVLDPIRKSDPVQGLQASGRTYEGLLADVADKCGTFPNVNALLSKNMLGSGPGVTTVRLGIRDKASTKGMTLRVAEPNEAINIQTVVQGETVFGNAFWCQLKNGGFCWSGGVLAT